MDSFPEQGVASIGSDPCSPTFAKTTDNVHEITVFSHISSKIESPVIKGTTETSIVPCSVEVVLPNVSTEVGLLKPTRPVRHRHLPQHLKDYRVNLPKARTSSHTVAQAMSY
ncbi:hypothetical protein V6N11_052226 [Hibiscus sabdariffa]|uniref:Uncharacterized protein n=1 Tax=Hibiscus sabdariffa TaxID=183260 RepID=A0ABR2U9P9_9ROSI